MGMVKLPRRLRRDAKLMLLAASPALAPCHSADLVALAAAADLVQCDEGDLLAVQSSPHRYWWLVLEGRLEILWNSSWASSIEAGQAFGTDVDDADHAERLSDQATIVATEPSVVLVASRASLLGLIVDRPRLAEVIGRASADLFGQEFEELLRRAGDDRPVTADHDRSFDERGMSGQGVEHLVAARSGQAELAEQRLPRTGDHEGIIRAQQSKDALQLAPRRGVL